MSRPPAFFWQNMPAHHQAGALDRLSAQWGAPVTAVWAGGLSPQRMADGWRPLACASLRQITLPSEGWAEQVRALVADHAGAIHVFSGIGAYPPLDLALGYTDMLSEGPFTLDLPEISLDWPASGSAAASATSIPAGIGIT